MTWLEFLNRLEESLNQIEVKGENNLRHMMGCLMAIDDMRQSLFQVTPPEKGGEANGRQSDIGTDSGNDSNGE